MSLYSVVITPFFPIMFQMARYKNKNIRQQWTKNDLERAVALVKQGSSQRQASLQTKVPRRTLQRYMVKTRSTEVPKLGRKSTLTPDQEKELVTRILRLAEVGCALTPSVVRKCVYDFVESKQIPHNFSHVRKMAGKDWLCNFRKRHPNLIIRKAQKLNPARAQKLNKQPHCG
uniref:HTH CENPB-type domain-containing protein n=1 Tax=Cacopsylla melanoneura TaxID=428564 RepID=A0A8D8YZN8_9HEMI